MLNTPTVHPAGNVRVAVIIPAFEGGQALLQCLESLALSTYGQTQIIVVDNASTDGSPDQARHRFGSIEILRNPTNSGFGVACNAGMRRAIERGAEFVLLINQDTLSSPDLIDKLVACAHERPLACVIGAKTLSTQPMPDRTRTGHHSTRQETRSYEPLA